MIYKEQSVQDALSYGRDALKAKGIDTANLDAALLLMRAASLSLTELATKNKHILTPEEFAAYKVFITRRAAHEPVQYILGDCEFMSLKLYVDKGALIPRPDTEILAEAVIQHANAHPGPVKALELCTGSGCLSVALACFVKDADICAVDISPKALEVAAINAAKHGVSDKIAFVQGDLYAGAPKGEAYGIIFANPPYIPTGDMKSLPASVGYEPAVALDGGEDGLTFYRAIIKDGVEYLKPGGAMLLEIGWNQARAVEALFAAHGYGNIRVLKDLSGKDRVVTAIKY